MQQQILNWNEMSLYIYIVPIYSLDAYFIIL